MAAGSDAGPSEVAHIVLLDSDFACMKDIVRETEMMIISNIESQRPVFDEDDLFILFV